MSENKFSDKFQKNIFADSMMEIKMKRKQDGQYAAFMLDDISQFYMTGYKILRKQESRGLLPCFKEKYNGRLKLLYPIGGLTPLSYDAVSWKEKDVRENIGQMISIVHDLMENGFLQPEAVQPDLDFMFIDKTCSRIYLIVLPVNVAPEITAAQEWLAEFKRTLLSIIGFCGGTDDGTLAVLKNKVIRQAQSLEALCDGMNRMMAREPSGKSEKTDARKNMRLVLVSPPGNFNLEVNKPEFTVGKLRGGVDGLIDFTPTVSRKHCQITHRDGRFYIQDLGSANYTYINNVMLSPMQSPVEIKEGDSVRLAELEFKVQFV